MPTLDWIGKQAVVNHHQQVPYRLLHCDPARSAGDPESPNLLVQGDNLLALKALLPYYAGKVKCIYIDPPYNTGNEGWIYNDNVNAPEIKQWLGRTVDAEDLSRHDKWLCMIYPRLKLLREFLTEDGVLFVSIDDNEVDTLRGVLDELFQRPNRVGTIVWKNAADNNPTRIVPEHEYVLCYAKDLAKTPAEWKAESLPVKDRLLEIEAEFIKSHTNAEERQTAYTKWYRENRPHLWPFQDYKFIDEHGIYTGMRSVHNPGKEGYRYAVLHPVTNKPCQLPLMGYRFPESTMSELLKEGRILFGDDESKLIELKVYARDYKSKLSSVFELDGRRGTNEIKAVFPESKRPFNFPKPTALIEEFLSICTKHDDLILDSFAGSGTSGHALLEMNRKYGSNRRFILIEMEEKIATDVTAQRLRRVIEGYKNSKGEQVEGLGGGFRYCTLSEPLFNADGTIREQVKYKDLAHHVFFTETGRPLPKNTRGPLLGTHEGKAIYLLFNGILHDKSYAGGNVLTRQTLESCGGTSHDGERIIYGESSRLTAPILKRLRVTFKQLPYDVKVS